ncbi:disease resistance protein PIK6-NP [Lolium perenne]|uniref:disease resistance protein PIK6-NP n=1 Tax=Lolium perenne TaxID=4522 RepID=UPI0021F5985A|nr:disease resistance protein PIK6-NP-like [Lolium perenne]
MEATALSVGKSVLNGALSYANSALAEEVALQLGVRRDHLFITNELEMMQAFLESAHDEGDDINRVVKVWVKQVRDVAYDVEDTLQEFSVRLEKKSWWRIRRTLLDRRRVAKQMKELRANVEDVSQRNMRYNLIKGSDSKPATTGGQSAIAGATMMSGNDEARRQLEKAKDDLFHLIRKRDDDLRVIAVWGTSSNLRRTSIIERVFADLKKHSVFDCHAWITLTHPFNSTEFLRSIIRQFYVNFLQESDKKEKIFGGPQDLRRMGMKKGNDLVDEFKRYVNEKSFLIVLDDVSTIEEWDCIKTCFPNNKKGSRIIVSTELVEVASLCVGPENITPEHKQLSVDLTLYAFYEKGSLDGTESTEAGSSSNVGTHVSDSSDNRKMLNRRETMLAALKESRLIGRETEKAEIVKLITTEDSQLDVISVWGMGGLGKTTLVRDVYQDEILSGKFEKRACATIMRPFNVNELLQNLALQFGYKDVPEMNKELPGKKYLIVLDDISSNAEWDAIIQHFHATETSCRIIVTTRVKDIATHCSKKHEKIYRLQSLEDTNALDLFAKKIFGKATNMDEEYPELVEHANLILKKCNGLPLAIVTIGGFLANQPKTVMEWRKLNEHIRAELVMNPEIGTIRTILMRSYDGLPYYLKSCFLYMPIFPEDYLVGRKRLVRRWSAEGYSREVQGKSMEEIADGYFMELISRSMILPSESSIHSTKGINSCQVHDLMRDIGISKSMEENLVFALEEGCSSNIQGTMRHLAINGNWKGDQSEFEGIVDMARVRSVTVFGEWKSFFISDKMSLLRVLDLEDTTGLRDHHLKHIGKFLHLRYLSLRGCHAIYHLPDSLGNLRELVTLDVRGTRIIELPRSIVNLQKLSYLRSGRKPTKKYGSYEGTFEDSPKFRDNQPCIMFVPTGVPCCWRSLAAEMLYDDNDLDDNDLNFHDACTAFCCHLVPFIAMRLDLHGVLVQSGMRKLKALHTLGVVNIAMRGKDVLKDIKGLIHLRKLGVTGVKKENGQELCLAIVGLSRLESLSIRSEGEPGLSSCLDGEFSFPKNLQSLKLYGKLVKLPEWIKGLRNLVKLKLRSCRISEHDEAIEVLGDLPNLACLHLLKKSFEQSNACLTFRPHMFRNLVVLELDSLLIDQEAGNKFLFLKFERGATPKLELLKFRRAHINSLTLSGLPSLASLKEVLLQGGYTNNELVYLRAKLEENPNRPVIKRV